MTFVGGPIPVVLTDKDGYSINVGTGSGSFNAAPTPVVVTDAAGNAATVGSLNNVYGFNNMVNPVLTLVNPALKSTGDQDLYTIPAGKRAVVMVQAYNPTGGTIVAYPLAKLSGVYYRLASSTSLTTATGSNMSYQGFVFEAGDIVGINIDTAGVAIRLSVLLFDNTSALKTGRVVVTTGDNTVYTVPAGKTAMLSPMILFVNTAIGFVEWTNESGGALTYHWNAVPSGGSASSTNQITNNAQSVGNNAIASTNLFLTLTAGDFLSINSSGPGKQLAFVTVVEK